MEIAMDNITFCKKLWDIAGDVNTVYMKGTFGAPVTEATILSRSSQYPKWYNAQKQAELRKLIGKNYFGFDCVCLIKGVIWGWNADKTHPFGGAQYCKHGLNDLTVTGLRDCCKDLSTDFTQIQKGELLYMPGHVGVYLGDGFACECTPIWSGGVQITSVANVCTHKGYNSRTWQSHGKIPVISYKAPYVKGDVDGDGKVSARDCELLKKALIGLLTLTPEQQERCDMNNDGKLTTLDYYLLRAVYLGLY